MKILLVWILVCSFNTFILADENTLNGFRDLKWGEPITKYENVMQLTSESGKLKNFMLAKNEEMLFDDVMLASISYVFYDGRFSSAIIQTDKSASNFK